MAKVLRKKSVGRKPFRQSRARIQIPDWLPGPKVSLNASAAEIDRFHELGIGSPFRLVKPKQTLRLYGMSQRLSALILRDDIRRGDRPAPTKGSPEHRFISKIDGLSPDDARFLRAVILAVLNGERDAYRAFDLSLPKVRRGGIKPRLICACYALAQSIWTGKEHSKAVRQWVAELWGVTPPRVSQCKRLYGSEAAAWIQQAVRVAQAARVSRELVLARLLDLVIHELNTDASPYLPNPGVKVGLSTWPPEGLFNVEFPAALPSLELAIQIGSR